MPRPELSYQSIIEAAAEDPRRLVTVEREDGYAVVTLDDPDRMNALGAPLTVQLHAALREETADPAIRAIVLTGRDPAFSAGGDLGLMTDVAHPLIDEGAEGGADVWRWIRYEFGGIARLIARSDTAFVAAVNGAAAGVGLAFALSCDVLLASERARLVPAFGRIGLLPEVGTGWALTRQVGYQGAFALMARGRHLDAHEAFERRLVTEVHPHAELLPCAREWAQDLVAMPPHVLSMGKTLLRQVADLSWEQALAVEEFAEPTCFTTRQHREAVAALQRRD
jgi:2-(1,2-epoxy-1,2-dihydrophenyl)acetyl-CoA isomerase